MAEEVLHHSRNLDSVADVDYVVDLVNVDLSFLVGFLKQKEKLIDVVQANQPKERFCFD